MVSRGSSPHATAQQRSRNQSRDRSTRRRSRSKSQGSKCNRKRSGDRARSRSHDRSPRSSKRGARRDSTDHPTRSEAVSKEFSAIFVSARAQAAAATMKSLQSDSESSSSGEKELVLEEKTRFNCTFAPGMLGLRYDSASGNVLEVSADGQAMQKGVRAGMQIVMIGSATYSHNAFVAAREGSSNYQVTFKVAAEEAQEVNVRQDTSEGISTGNKVAADNGGSVSLHEPEDIRGKANDRLAVLSWRLEENEHEAKLTELSQEEEALQTRRGELKSRTLDQSREKEKTACALEVLKSESKNLQREEQDDAQESAKLTQRAEVRRREQEEDERRMKELLLREEKRKLATEKNKEDEILLAAKMQDLKREERETSTKLDEVDQQIIECSLQRGQLIRAHAERREKFCLEHVEHMKKCHDLKHKEDVCGEGTAEVSQMALGQGENAQEIVHGEQLAKVEDPIEVWLRNLDGGRGSMLCYLEPVRQEFEHLEALRASFVKVSINGSLVGHVDPSVWDAIGADKQGHRLLIAKGIIALQ